MSVTKRLSNSLKGGSSMRLLLLTGAVLAVGAIYVLNMGGAPVPVSEIRGPVVDNPTVQGRDPVSPAMNEELADADEDRVQDALQTGASAMPTLRATEQESLDLAAAGPEDEPTVVERPKPPVIQRPVVTPPPAPTIPVAVQPMQQAPVVPLSERMATIAAPVYPAASVEYFADMADFAPPPAPSQTPGQSAAPVAVSAIQLPLPGTVLYAEMISEANSDSPGPVLAQIVQGPLTGARLIGSFETQRETLVVSFHTLTMGTDREGNQIDETIPISAYAVDAGTIGTGVATDVDYHLLQNIGITFAAAFAQGFGQAIAQSGQQIISNDNGTTVVNPTLTTQQQLLVATGTAAGAAGQSLNQLFGNRPITIKVKSGTGIGVFFLPSGAL